MACRILLFFRLFPLLLLAFLFDSTCLQAETTLSWSDNSDNEDGFYVERSVDSAPFERIATLPADSTTFTDSTTVAGPLYTYRVQAFNAFGTSGYTNVAFFDMLEIAHLAIAPQSQLAATLSWADLSKNEDGFYIERSVDGGDYVRFATLPADSTNFTDTSTINGPHYSYRVQAFNSFGLSPFTNNTNFGFLEIADLAITNPSETEPTLSWADLSENEDGFYIERSIDSAPFERIATLPADSTLFADPTTVTGPLYSYRIQAFNAFGTSAYTNLAFFDIPAPISFEDWISRMFATNLFAESSFSPNKILRGADLPNLLCYAHGINPFQPNRSLLPMLHVHHQDGQAIASIEHAVFKFSQGISTTLLVSSDLVHWSPLKHETQILSETNTHRWESIPLPDFDQSRFYRLAFTLATSTSQ